MISRTLAVASLSSAALLLIACDQGSPQGGAASPEPAASPRSHIVNGDASDDGATTDPGFAVPVETRREIVAFSRELAAHMTENNSDAIDEAISFGAFVSHVTDGLDIDVNQPSIKKIRRELIEGLETKPGGIVTELMGFPCTFLRYREVDGMPRPLFRSLINAGVGYWELVPELRPTGDVLVADIYQFASGASVSESTRRLLGPLLSLIHI